MNKHKSLVISGRYSSKSIKAIHVLSYNTDERVRVKERERERERERESERERERVRRGEKTRQREIKSNDRSRGTLLILQCELLKTHSQNLL